MATAIAEYHRVLQEESERVCGKHLPDEIVWIILYRWGGLQTPTAGLIRAEMRLMPAESSSKNDRYAPIDTTQWKPRVGPLAITKDIVTHFSLNNVLRTAPLKPVRFPINGYANLYAALLGNNTYFYYRLNQNADHYFTAKNLRWRYGFMIDDGYSERYAMWKAALEYRGCSDKLIERASRLGVWSYTNRDSYDLLRRAETDYTWRFWWDALGPKVSREHAREHAVAAGVSLTTHATLLYGLSRVLTERQFSITLLILSSAELYYGLRQLRLV